MIWTSEDDVTLDKYVQYHIQRAVIVINIALDEDPNAGDLHLWKTCLVAERGWRHGGGVLNVFPSQ